MFQKYLSKILCLILAVGLLASTVALASKRIAVSGTPSGTLAKPNDYIAELEGRMQDIPSIGEEHTSSETSTQSANSAQTASIPSVGGTAVSKISHVASASKKASNSSKKQTSSTTAGKTSSKPSSNAQKPSSGSSASKPSSSSSPSPSSKTLIVSVGGGAPQKLDAADIIARVVAMEMDSSFEVEALKAQAVATHTFIQYCNNNGKAPSVPTRTPDAKIKNAVASVLDKMIYYNGKPINAVYHATSAGKTNASEDVWGEKIPYLRSVEVKYDHLAPGYQATASFSKDDFKTLVSKNTGVTLSSNASNWVKIQSRTQGGYVANISLDGQKTVTGRQMRESILLVNGTMKLRSAKFDYAVKGDTVVFTTYGYGHGAGMSQTGANLYAKKDGWSYDRILKHFYTGVTVK